LAARLNRLLKKSKTGAKIVPQGLKPRVVSSVYGTAEAVPFHKAEFFSSL
jgi:hypothetical protein